MAKAQLGPLVDSVQGKAGQLVFLQTRYGPVVRPKVIPTDPRTALQQSMRANFAKVAQAWRELDDDQFQAWQAYSPAPYRAFSALALKLLQAAGYLPGAGIELPTIPPDRPFNPPRVEANAAYQDGRLVFTLASPLPPGVAVEFLAQPLAHPRRKPIEERYRTLVITQTQHSEAQPPTPPPPALALAYRQLDLATGQQTKPDPLPILSLP